MSILSKIFKDHEVLGSFDGKISEVGRFSGIENNEYWLVKNKETGDEYYMMDCGKLNLAKIDKQSIDKIIKDLKTNPEAKKIIKKALYAEEAKRDDITNEYYYRSRIGTNDNTNSGNGTGNSKLLYKLRNKAIDANKKDDKARTKRLAESVFENVNFNTIGTTDNID